MRNDRVDQHPLLQLDEQSADTQGELETESGFNEEFIGLDEEDVRRLADDIGNEDDSADLLNSDDKGVFES